ncbi:unnamed protein product [Candida verbasci]|uniref:Uncharacterized protein n=1 Tax=Candida verbasci TaxID=1227364 RepID=A0A9W4TTM3_9ASCO|nr:unnamed protein product [Candida verbasci]
MNSPVNTPTKKRVIKDISNNYDNSHHLLTPTRTPSKKRIKLDVTDAKKPSCVKKLNFDNLPPTPNEKESPFYSFAKSLFQRGANTILYNDKFELIGREEEAQEINNFISTNLKSNRSSSLYISGPPGTGKTAQINLSLSKFETQDNVKIVQINCMTLNQPDSIFHEIYCQLINKNSSLTLFKKKKTHQEFIDYINEEFKKDHIILILDELDSLITKDQQVLYKLFQIASKNQKLTINTQFSFIGISNTLDLSNKLLPILIKSNLLPETLQFLPYSSNQIKSIIENRLTSNNLLNLFQPIALQFCCRKSSSISGDLRKSFDIVYKCIEMIEKEKVKQIQMGHVAKICVSTFENNPLNNLNFLQKVILCQLFNYQIEMKETIHTRINLFYDYYRRQQEEKNLKTVLGAIKFSEFIEILNALESNCCINLTNNNKLIKLNIKYDELKKSIEQEDLLKKILNNTNHNNYYKPYYKQQQDNNNQHHRQRQHPQLNNNTWNSRDYVKKPLPSSNSHTYSSYIPKSKSTSPPPSILHQPESIRNNKSNILPSTKQEKIEPKIEENTEVEEVEIKPIIKEEPVIEEEDTTFVKRPLNKLESEFEDLKENFKKLKPINQWVPQKFSLNKKLLINFKLNKDKLTKELKSQHVQNLKRKQLLHSNYQVLQKRAQEERIKMDQQLKILNKDNHLKNELDSNINNSYLNQPTSGTKDEEMSGSGNNISLPTLSSRRSSRRHGDLITSEAEFQEILLSLGKENDEDPLVKAEKVAAAIPDLIIDPIERNNLKYLDSNNIIKDKKKWSSRVKSDFTVHFNEKEHELFTEGFCLYPKRFGAISRHMGGLRSPNECVIYYYQTKKLYNYKELVIQFRKKASKKGRKSKKTSITSTTKSPAPEIDAPNNIIPVTIESSEIDTPIELQMSQDTPILNLTEELYTETGRRKRAAAPTSFEKKSHKKVKTSRIEPEDNASITDIDKSNVATGTAPLSTPSPSAISTDDGKRKTISSYWSITEANAFPKLLEEFGTRWTAIADKIQTKSTTMVRNYYSRNAEKNGWTIIAEEADLKYQKENPPPPPPTEQPQAQQPPPQSQSQSQTHPAQPQQTSYTIPQIHYVQQPIQQQYIPIGTFHNPMPSISSIIQHQQPHIYHQQPPLVQHQHVNPSINNLLSEPPTQQQQSQHYPYYQPQYQQIPQSRPPQLQKIPPVKSSIMSLLNDPSPTKQNQQESSQSSSLPPPQLTRPKTKLHDLLNGPDPNENTNPTASVSPSTNQQQQNSNNNNGSTANTTFKRSGIASLLSD